MLLLLPRPMDDLAEVRLFLLEIYELVELESFDLDLGDLFLLEGTHGPNLVMLLEPRWVRVEPA